MSFFIQHLIFQISKTLSILFETAWLNDARPMRVKIRFQIPDCVLNLVWFDIIAPAFHWGLKKLFEIRSSVRSVRSWSDGALVAEGEALFERRGRARNRCILQGMLRATRKEWLPVVGSDCLGCSSGVSAKAGFENGGKVRLSLILSHPLVRGGCRNAGLSQRADTPLLATPLPPFFRMLSFDSGLAFAMTFPITNLEFHVLSTSNWLKSSFGIVILVSSIKIVSKQRVLWSFLGLDNTLIGLCSCTFSRRKIQSLFYSNVQWKAKLILWYSWCTSCLRLRHSLCDNDISKTQWFQHYVINQKVICLQVWFQILIKGFEIGRPKQCPEQNWGLLLLVLL